MVGTAIDVAFPAAFVMVAPSVKVVVPAGANQTVVDQYLAPAGDTYWVQRQNAATGAGGTRVSIDDTAPTTDLYDLAAVEVLAAP